MNAFQPSKPPLRSVDSVHRRVASRSRHHRHPYRVMALETTVKLSVNVVLSVIAVCTLAQLWQHNCSQQKKLQAIRMEDERIEGRVNHLRTDFSRYFDPEQAKNIMQEQSDRLAPGQYPVVLLAPGAKGVAATAPISKK